MLFIRSVSYFMKRELYLFELPLVPCAYGSRSLDSLFMGSIGYHRIRFWWHRSRENRVHCPSKNIGPPNDEKFYLRCSPRPMCVGRKKAVFFRQYFERSNKNVSYKINIISKALIFSSRKHHILTVLQGAIFRKGICKKWREI